MNRCLTASVALVIVGAATAFAQAAPPTASPDGLEILKQAAQHYADAKSYRIEAVEERTSSNEFRRSWEKTSILAAEAPGGRYHYEGHSGLGGASRVSDGKTVWVYHMDVHQYTQEPMPSQPSSRSQVINIEDMPFLRAQSLRKELAGLASYVKSATRLPDATLDVDGREILCYVARVRTADMKRVSPGYSFERTYWIDKAHETIVRTVEHGHNYLMVGAARIPMEEDSTITYSMVELGGAVDNELFAFIPPPDAKLVEEFLDPREGGHPDLSGQQVPAIKLKSSEGKLVSLDSFRGKPVLLDIWATWCVPCVVNLKHLAQIYREAADKGLVLISVDQDEEGKTAADFLAKNGYTWPNFHDDGESISALGPSPIPRAILIDAQGKVVYDGSGSNEGQLRAAIAKLGPEYSFLAPKPEPSPCSASK